jgi:hypothetical protein
MKKTATPDHLNCVAAALTALGLAACGGGGSDAGTPSGPDTTQRTQAPRLP